MKTRIMYIESKSGGFTGPARIGRVTFSKSGATLYYQGRAFQSQKGGGYKSNFVDVEAGDGYWISGPHKDGRDALCATHTRPEVDPDVHDEYWSRKACVPPLRLRIWFACGVALRAAVSRRFAPGDQPSLKLNS